MVHDVSSFLKKLKSGDDDDNDPKSKKHAKSAPKANPQSQKSKQIPKPATNTSEVREQDYSRFNAHAIQSTKAPRKQDKKFKKDAKSKKQPETKVLPPAAPETEPIPIPEIPKKITFNSKTTFILQPLPQWYNVDLTRIQSSTLASPAELSQITTRAASLHARDIEAFQVSSSAHTSEAGFLSKIIQSGTLSDRLSALTLLVQSGPIHNIKALETLKTMAERGKGKGGREESLKALRCIVDWWVGGGAPSRKLK